MKAEVLWSHLTWENELEGNLAKSRSESGVIKNCISYYHNKTVYCQGTCHKSLGEHDLNWFVKVKCYGGMSCMTLFLFLVDSFGAGWN